MMLVYQKGKEKNKNHSTLNKLMWGILENSLHCYVTNDNHTTFTAQNQNYKIETVT